MAACRLLQISDTHLSRSRPLFLDNWHRVVEHADRLRPDLIVHTGDLTLDGAEAEDDLAFAALEQRRLPAPLLAVPGNHDIGDNPAVPGALPAQPVSPERRARYLRHLPPDWWVVEAAGWRLIGLNSQILGSGLAAEEEQWAFLDEALAAGSGRPAAVFLHKPPFVDSPAEDAADHRMVPPAPRHRLMALFRQGGVRLVACGHLHQHLRLVRDGITFVWAPSTAFTLANAAQPAIGAERLGVVEYVLGEDGVTVDLRTPPGLRHHRIASFRELETAGAGPAPSAG